MVKKCFNIMCLTLGLVGLVGCSNNGDHPLSVNEVANPGMAKVGSNGASFVSSGKEYVYAVSKDIWPNGNHKIYILVNNDWFPLESYSSVDAKKLVYDPGAHELWILATNNTLWKGIKQQFFTPENNDYGKTGPIIAFDITMQEVDDRGTIMGRPYILLNEQGDYGKKIWFLNTLGGWERYGTVPGFDESGVAIAFNPNEDSDYSGDLWLIRNNGNLLLWNCSIKEWQLMDSGCLAKLGKADVAVATDNTVYYLTSNRSGYDYKIRMRKNHSKSWTENGSGIALGASDKGWAVRNSTNIYKFNGSNWDRY